MATLTYVYQDSTAVVGPLATAAEPHSYDLCEEHAVRLTVPRGWEVLRHVGDFPPPLPYVDDLEALADAVREAARVEITVPTGQLPPHAPPPVGGRTARAPGSGPARPGSQSRPGSAVRRGHLRVVPPPVE